MVAIIAACLLLSVATDTIVQTSPHCRINDTAESTSTSSTCTTGAVLPWLLPVLLVTLVSPIGHKPRRAWLRERSSGYDLRCKVRGLGFRVLGRGELGFSRCGLCFRTQTKMRSRFRSFESFGISAQTPKPSCRVMISESQCVISHNFSDPQLEDRPVTGIAKCDPYFVVIAQTNNGVRFVRRISVATRIQACEVSET